MVNQLSLSPTKCRHCGTVFTPRHEAESFCCMGCRVVHDLIEEGGFSDFYRLLGRNSLTPLNDQPVEPVNLEWLEGEESVPRGELTGKVGNLSCTACVWLLERLFRKRPGAIRIAVNTTRASIALWWDPDVFDLHGFLTELHRFGYPVSKADADAERDAEFAESRSLMTRLGVSFGLALNTMAFTLPSYLGLAFSDDLASLFRLVAFASSTIALAVGGSYFFQRALVSLKTRLIHMDVPISLGLAIAYAGSLAGYALGIERLMYFDFVATFVTLMLLGRWLHVRMIENNRSQLRAKERQVISLRKQSVEDGRWMTVAPGEIREGDTVEIRPGSLVPIRGTLLSPPKTSLSLDWINGEPVPVPAELGAEVPAGARNVSGERMTLKARETFAGSLMEKLLSTRPLSSEGSIYPGILQAYLLTVVLVSLAGGAAWFIATSDPVRALQVWISVLVVSCPCALGLALPLVDEMINARMRKDGIFVRNNRIWRDLLRIRKVIFDKTGTLTEPAPVLKNPAILESLQTDEIEALSVLLKNNRHPHGTALREAIVSIRGPEVLSPNLDSAPEEIVSKGVECRIRGTVWRLGRADWALRSPGECRGTALSKDGESIAVFEIGETIRESARGEMDLLRNAGLDIEILSGDPVRERVVATGLLLGIPEERIFSGQSPREKAQHLAGRESTQTLFVGDGGNDGPALEAAGCSGASATGIGAIESKADFVFMGRDLRAIGTLLRAARKRRRFVVLIFALAVGYNAVAVSLCLAGLMSPLLAAILMPLSSLVTTAIASRSGGIGERVS